MNYAITGTGAGFQADDYTDTGNGSVTIPTTGTNADITIDIRLNADNPTGAETISVTLSDSNSYTVNASRKTVNATITEPADPTVFVRVDGDRTTIDEPDVIGGTSTATIVFEVSPMPSAEVTVTYTVAPVGGATAADLTIVDSGGAAIALGMSQTLMLNAGNMWRETLTLTALDDDLVEPGRRCQHNHQRGNRRRCGAQQQQRRAADRW